MEFVGVRRQAFRSLVLTGAVLSTVLLGVTDAGAHDSHVVVSGDTLSEIAQDTGTTVVGLMAENDLSSPDRIRIGQVLSIPHRDGSGHASAPAAATPAAPSAGTYVVAPGDTLGHIAIRTGVSSRDIAEANGITNPNRIRVGQKLSIPGGTVATSNYPDLPQRLQDLPERRALIPIFERWAAANDIPVDLLMSVAWQESGWNNSAVSFKGAVGIGQIMPPTGEWVAADLIGRPDLDTTIPEDNIRISARYIRWLLDYLGTEDLALAGYYQGPGAVRAGIMYEDTVQYVDNVQVHRRFFVAS